MPRAILALRQYPLALLIAAVLFLCSLIIATQSLGVIRSGGGGDDQGSGMGGTGKSGGFGDSGFGGTGGPVPYLGDSGLGDSGNQDSDGTDAQDSDWPAPWFPREVETADIPDDMQPLIELQRNPPVDPFTQPATPVNPDTDTLRIQDLANDERIAPETRRIIELANRQDRISSEEPVLEIQATVPDMPSVTELVTESLALQEPEPEERQSEALQEQPTEEADMDPDRGRPLNSPTLAISEDADSAEDSDAQPSTEPSIDELRRDTPERISRPELPPFQRMRPAVDRASITPPRPQPMRI